MRIWMRAVRDQGCHQGQPSKLTGTKSQHGVRFLSHLTHVLIIMAHPLHPLLLAAPINAHIDAMNESSKHDDDRLNTKFTPQLLSHIKRARTNKILNKTREKERERDGEVLNATLRRGRKGAPAHVWVKMSEEERNKMRERRRAAIAATLERRLPLFRRGVAAPAQSDRRPRRGGAEPEEQLTNARSIVRAPHLASADSKTSKCI